MIRYGKKSIDEVEKIYNEIDRISNKYNIPAATLRAIVREYGSLDTFKSKYIEYATGTIKMDEKVKLEKYLKKVKGKYIRAFDLNSPDLIFRGIGYCDINRIPNYSIFLDGEDIKEKTERVIDSIPEKWSDILRIYYGLKIEQLNLNKIAEEYGSSRQNISEKFKRAKAEYDKYKYPTEEYGLIKDNANKEKFITAFFNNNDMFYNEIEYETTKNTPNEYQKFINDMIIQAANLNNLMSTAKPKDKQCEGIEKVLEKIHNLRNNIDEINSNSYTNKTPAELKIERKILRKLSHIEDEIYKYRLKEEYLSNDYRELVQILTELKNIEKITQGIEGLGLSKRTYNVLKRNKINTLQNISGKSEKELMEMKGFGKDSLCEIKNKIHEHGLRLSDEKQNRYSYISDETQELETKYEALKIKIVESERLRKILISDIKKSRVDKINCAKILSNFDAWLLENGKNLKTEEERENIYKLRDDIQKQLYSKKVEEFKWSSDLMYVEKRIEDFKKEKEGMYNSITEMER